MTTVGLSQISGLEDAATAGGTAVSAAVFLRRALRTGGPRRAAALLLAGLLAAIATGAVGHLAGSASGEGSGVSMS